MSKSVVNLLKLFSTEGCGYTHDKCEYLLSNKSRCRYGCFFTKVWCKLGCSTPGNPFRPVPTNEFESSSFPMKFYQGELHPDIKEMAPILLKAHVRLCLNSNMLYDKQKFKKYILGS